MGKNYLFEGEQARRFYEKTKGSEITKQMLGFILENTALKKDVLVADLAAGSGNFEEFLREKVKRIDAVDLSGEMVRIMEQRFKGDMNVRVIKADITGTPLDSGTYGVVLLIMSLHHVSEGGAVLKEASRIIRAGGRLILIDRLAVDKNLAKEFDIVDAEEKGIKGGHGHTQRTGKELESMLRKHFRILKKTKIPYPGRKGRALEKVFYCLEK